MVIQTGSYFVRIMALSFGFIGLQQTLNGTFMGAGETKASMMLSILALWIIQFPLAFTLSKFTSLGATGIWWSIPISNVLAATAAYMWFLKGNWKHKELIGSALDKEILEETTIDEGI